MNEIIIYQYADEAPRIEVKFEGETLWLNQYQLAELFEGSRSNIVEHIRNIYRSGELDKKSTCRKFRQARLEGARKVKRDIEHYNLDLIISVGYRVNSKRGIQFRQWATERLKDYLVKGYAINRERLDELKQTVQLIGRGIPSESLGLTEAKGLLAIIQKYTQSFVLLNQYDRNSFGTEKLNEDITYEITYKEAKTAIAELKKQLRARKEATALFGNEKDRSFKGTLQSIVQTFDGQYLYPSVEEQAAHLLYLVIKNHPFSDGNKRIGAFLFIWFLEKNKHRFRQIGELKINDNALVALALLVAQSAPGEKDLMIRLIVHLINDR